MKNWKMIYEVNYDGTDAGWDVMMKGNKLKVTSYDFGGTADGPIVVTWDELKSRLKDGECPSSKYPEMIAYELALYKEDGETFDIEAGKKIYDTWVCN